MDKKNSAVRRTEKVRYILYGSAAGLLVCSFIAALFVGEFAEISPVAANVCWNVGWSASLRLLVAGQAVHIWALRRDGAKWLSTDVSIHLGIVLTLLSALVRQFR